MKNLDNKLNFYIKNGYTILNTFTKEEVNFFKKEIENRINKLSSNAFKKKFNVAYYHKKNFDNDLHSKVIKQNKRYINLSLKIVKKIHKNPYIQNILNYYWNHHKFDLLMMGSRKKNNLDPFILNKASYRIARPFRCSQNDVGGCHYDLKYGGSENSNKNAFASLWTPICGFDKKYSLKIYPKTHLITHNINNLSRQKKFTSAVFKESYTKKFKSIRPNLKKGQSIFFHPNLLHGGSYNNGKISRVSLEFRLCNKIEFDKILS